jgi:Uncharacterized conserved protein
MAFDEMKAQDGAVRAPYRSYENWLLSVAPDLLPRKHEQADELFRRIGITFNVYGDQEGTERLIPFDPIPRILTAKEWTRIHDGCIQRVRALNAFIHDVYHDQKILKAGVIPREQVLANGSYRPEMHGLDVARQVYVQIAGVDVVRTGADEFYVLEDNLRTPSGVSYMLEDRAMMMRLFPDLFARYQVKPVDHYPDLLLKALRSVAPGVCDGEPSVVVLTPGYHNSAYFEHAFLAEQMGVDLVEGRDLFVNDGLVWMRTTKGPKRVDVIYRRIDDDFLDPLAFRPDSALGVPGLLSAYRSGGVTLANAIGTGVADDKSTYVYVPDMIKFYLDEEPILPNVPTWRLERDDDRKYVLEHLGELVVKEVNGSGGYGMLVGPTSTKEQIELFRGKILENPGHYIAQPTLALSTCPTWVEKGIAPRHVDLRPFVLSGETTALVPGGLTRVALKEGSLVVNSSQGGGTKDTWVLEDSAC